MESIIKLENAIIQIEHNQVLKDVNLDIANNEFIYLIGKTGSGKSSLMDLFFFFCYTLSVKMKLIEEQNNFNFSGFTG